MTITVDIRPEVQAELARQAAAHGRPVEAYAASLLEEAVNLPTGVSQPSLGKSLREVFETVRGLADDIEFSRNPSTGRPIDLS
jgi:plasmid stability protein